MAARFAGHSTGSWDGTPCRLLLVVLALAAALPAAAPLKLIVVGMPTHNSPMLDVMAVAAQLQSRGHEVYVVSDPEGERFAKLAAARHASNTTAEALQFVRVAANASMGTDALLGRLSPSALKSFGKPGIAGLRLLLTLASFIAQPCEMLLTNQTLMQELRGLEADAVMAFAIPAPFPDSCGCMFSHALGVPMVAANGNPLVMGAPLSVPQMASGTTPADLHTPAGFARNLAAHAFLNYVLPAAGALLGDPWAQARARLGLPRLVNPLVPPPVNWAVRVMLGQLWGPPPARCEPLSEVLLNTWLLEYPRPLAPYQVLVGPGTPRPAQPISPPEVADFVDSAPAGVVLMATGTTLQTRLVLSAHDVRELARGFAQLAPTRVLWPIKVDHLPPGVSVQELSSLGENIKLVSWVDYNDVLGHNNTRVLVSHCGWHSVCEAAYHGVPVVGVPFQMEQTENVRRLVHRGMAELMPHAPTSRTGRHANETFVAAEVAATIRKVMEDGRYAAAGAGMSHALQTYSRHRQPYTRAADEFELALNTWHAQQHWRQRQAQQRGATAGRRARADEL